MRRTNRGTARETIRRARERTRSRSKRTDESLRKGSIAMDRVLVVGFGNPLMGDDGAGPAVIEELRRRGGAGGHRFEDGGTDALALPALWQGELELWIVDAVQGGLPPGTLHRLDHCALLELPQRSSSCHRLSLSESLRWIRHSFPRMGDVRYRLWGIEPGRVEAREDLSPAVRRSIGSVAEEVLAALAGRSELCD